MGILSNLFGAKYQDDRLASHVEQALTEDPLLSDTAGITVTSNKGVVRLAGVVHRASEKERIERLGQETLRTVGLPYDRIVNEIEVV